MNLLRKKFSSKIDKAKNDSKELLDDASSLEGAVSAGALSYGAYKTGQVGKHIYDKVKAKKTKYGKFKELKNVGKKILKGSEKSLKELNTRDKILDGVKEKAKDNVKESKENLERIKESLQGKTTIDSELHDQLKKQIATDKRNIKIGKAMEKSAEAAKKLNETSKNLKKGKIALGVGLTTGASSLALNAISEHTKKKRREKIFSIQSGGPDKEGSLKRELTEKAKTGALRGSTLGSIVGLTVGVYSRDLKTLGISTIGGLTIGSVVGAFSEMLKSFGAKHRMKLSKGVGMNEILDYLEDIISESRNEGLNIRGKNLISRYIGLDQDPKNFDITMSCKDGIALILVRNNVSEKNITNLSNELEDIIKNNRLATYKSEKIKEGYLVALTIPSIKAFANFIYNICYNLHLRVNCITRDNIKPY